MNHHWRSILRTRSLASVTLHRKPGTHSVPFVSLPPGVVRARILAHLDPRLPVPTMVTVDKKPFIHMLFRAEFAEPWMTKFESDLPTDWLSERGFGNMEYFDIKVGVAPVGFDRRV